MLVAAIVAWYLAVDAEGKPLEEVAPPLRLGSDGQVARDNR